MRPPLPREHGAWGMLLLPLAAGLVLAGRADAALFPVTAMVFFAYVTRAPLESLARGRRDAATWGWLGTYLVLAGGSAAVLVVGLGRTAWWPPALLVLPALLLQLLASRTRRNRDLLNELCGAALLPLAGPVVYAAVAQRLDRLGWAAWLAFAIYNVTTVPYIRTWVMTRRAAKSATYAAAARRTSRLAWGVLAASTLAVMALAAARVWPPLTVLAFVPGGLRVVVGLRREDKVSMPIQQLGWIEMAQATLFAVAVTAALSRG